MGERGIGALSLADEIDYRPEVRRGDLIRSLTRSPVTDGTRWRSRTQMVRPDGAVAATVTTNGAWFGLRSRCIEAPPSELVAASVTASTNPHQQEDESPMSPTTTGFTPPLNHSRIIANTLMAIAR
jgi:acyl-CoA thioester hydrolase